ncbi:MAG: GTP-binding protein, partial [Sciscionella sp.]
MQVIATAGHVDHGKSALIAALTGMQPDRLEQERRRGLSIELGFAWTAGHDLPPVAFVDVPGHERFVGTMLAGVGEVPAVLFVLAADAGWQQQSTEHLGVLDALGVSRGLLVITKTDLAAPDAAAGQADRELRGTTLAGLPSVAVSARTGAGLPQLRAALADLVRALPEPDPAAAVRLWVDRSFTIGGAGTVVTGTLAAGTLSVGDQLQLGAEGKLVGVRGLQSMDTPQATATGVSRVAVNLRGVARDEITRGDVLLSPDAWLGTDVSDVVLEWPGAQLRLPATLTVHVGAAAVPARLRPLG